MASTKYTLTILTPRQAFYQAEISALVVEAIDGREGILPGHSPLMKELNEGEVKITERSGVNRLCHIQGGYLLVDQKKALLFTPTVFWTSVKT